MIELTPEQRQALEARHGEPVRVVDPATQDAYVLVPVQVYERLTGLVQDPLEGPASDVPPLFRRSQEAFWRDLPGLLKSWRTRGKWVAYHGDERIGVARDSQTLLRECLRRGLGKDDYYLDIIEPMPQPPWLLVEEVDYGLAEFTNEPPPSS
jgi:hypothetical protein